MTVKELIEKLQTFDLEREIFVKHGDIGYGGNLCFPLDVVESRDKVVTQNDDLSSYSTKPTAACVLASSHSLC